MDRPDRCQVCGKSKRLDGTPCEIQVGNRCGQHSGKWMCLGCFLRWTEQVALKQEAADAAH